MSSSGEELPVGLISLCTCFPDYFIEVFVGVRERMSSKSHLSGDVDIDLLMLGLHKRHLHPYHRDLTQEPRGHVSKYLFERNSLPLPQHTPP